MWTLSILEIVYFILYIKYIINFSSMYDDNVNEDQLSKFKHVVMY